MWRQLSTSAQDGLAEPEHNITSLAIDVDQFDININANTTHIHVCIDYVVKQPFRSNYSSGLGSPKFRLQCGRVCSNYERMFVVVEFDRIWPESTKFDNLLANKERKTWLFGRTRPKLIELDPTLSKRGPVLADFGKPWPKFGPSCSKFGPIWARVDRHKFKFVR